MATNTNDTAQAVLEAVAEDPELVAKVIGELRTYSDLFANGLYLIVIGVVLVFILQRLATRLLYRNFRNRRLIRVSFGFLYGLVLVFTGVMAMEGMSIDTSAIRKVALLVLIGLAVVAYFVIPFMPRLPFTVGQLVEIGGQLGTVDSISTFHTSLRRLDGTIVYFANPVAVSSKILNYHQTPTRRVEINLSVNNDSDLERTLELFLRLMKEDERVLEEPAPPAVLVVNVTASGVDLFAFCWVKNEDWFKTRSDLWLKLVDSFNKDDRLGMSLPQQEVFVHGKPPKNDPHHREGRQDT